MGADQATWCRSPDIPGTSLPSDAGRGYSDAPTRLLPEKFSQAQQNCTATLQGDPSTRNLQRFRERHGLSCVIGPVWPVGAGCYSQAVLPMPLSKPLYFFIGPPTPSVQDADVVSVCPCVSTPPVPRAAAGSPRSRRRGRRSRRLLTTQVRRESTVARLPFRPRELLGNRRRARRERNARCPRIAAPMLSDNFFKSLPFDYPKYGYPYQI